MTRGGGQWVRIVGPFEELEFFFLRQDDKPRSSSLVFHSVEISFSCWRGVAGLIAVVPNFEQTKARRLLFPRGGTW